MQRQSHPDLSDFEQLHFDEKNLKFYEKNLNNDNNNCTTDTKTSISHLQEKYPIDNISGLEAASASCVKVVPFVSYSCSSSSIASLAIRTKATHLTMINNNDEFKTANTCLNDLQDLNKILELSNDVGKYPHSNKTELPKNDMKMSNDYRKLSNETDSDQKIVKSKPKRSFALFGRTVGRRTKLVNQFHYNTYYNRKHQSPSTMIIQSSSRLSMSNLKKYNKIDWSEHAKAGVHIWSDDHNNPNNDSCYLNEPDNLEFHNIDCTVKCLGAMKNIAKKRCNICKIVVHESCIDLLQQNVKCRLTFRENFGRKKSFRDKEHSLANNVTSTSAAINVNLHHWICRKYDENNFENRCQTCLKTYTNRFGLQTNRTIISCSWCKTAHHLKCFPAECFKTECTFGDLNQLIVPPSWIVKLSNKNSIRSSFLLKPFHRISKRNDHQDRQEMAASNASATSLSTNNQLEAHAHLAAPTLQKQISIRHANRAFIVRPPSTITTQCLSLAKPLLVLINPKSGGKIGPKLLKKFTWLLNARQVFDLSQCPKFPNVPNLQLLVGGGDGSVGWVLSVIDQIKFLVSPPSVAILPLGTGNDLARALNWGGCYTYEPLSKILAKIVESRSVKLDRWKISTIPNPDVNIESLEKDEHAIDKLKNDVMNNYFSLGADAHIALDFHERREANPQKFTSRWFNVIQYIEAGGKDMIKKTWKDLKDFIQLECDNVSYTDVIRNKGYHFILFLNIPKYSGGTNPWGNNSNDSNFQPQAMNDGRIEVIGCYTSSLARFHIGATGDKICQAKHVKLKTSTYIPIQIDGEPAKLCPSIIEIQHKNQAIMLEHVKNNTDSPLLDFNQNLGKNFEIKCILMPDYQSFRKDTKALEIKAIYIGKIYTSHLLDNLSRVRNTINNLIKNCTNHAYQPQKWSFLNAEEFYRLSDDTDESLLDIVSINEIIYILDETVAESESSNLNELNEEKQSESEKKVEQGSHLQKLNKMFSLDLKEPQQIASPQINQQISSVNTLNSIPSFNSSQYDGSFN